MQGTKLTRAKLWIAGVSTIAILVGCEAEPVKEQAANSNESEGCPAKTRQDCRVSAVGQAAPVRRA